MVHRGGFKNAFSRKDKKDRRWSSQLVSGMNRSTVSTVNEGQDKGRQEQE